MTVQSGFVGGDKLFQLRAARALPILVRQARAQKTIPYSALASELGMKNPRNCNYVLGAIGEEIESLGKNLGWDIPRIECLAVSKHSGVPSEGFYSILPNSFHTAGPVQRRRILENLAEQVWAFGRWNEVLERLGLKETAIVVGDSSLGGNARDFAYGFGGPESEEHRILKRYIAANPWIVGVPPSAKSGIVEYLLESGDEVDVLFAHRTELVGVEVKAARVPEHEVRRGLFQTVKYQALLEAHQRFIGAQLNCRTVLVIGGKLSLALRATANVLGVNVVEGVTPPSRSRSAAASS